MNENLYHGGGADAGRQGHTGDGDRTDEARRSSERAAEAHYVRGAVLLGKGEAAAAAAEFGAALDLRPAHAPALRLRSRARVALGDKEGAERDALAAVDLSPTAEAVARLGVIRHSRRDFAAAVADYSRAVELNPGLVWLYVLRGSARYHLSDRDGARADFQRAANLDAGVFVHLVCQAVRRDGEANPGKELAECAVHLREDPDDAFSHARRGLLLVLHGRDAEAEDDLDAFRAREPWGKVYLDLMVADLVRHRQKRNPGAPPAGTARADELSAVDRVFTDWQPLA